MADSQPSEIDPGPDPETGSNPLKPPAGVAVIAIGRNEGERLKRCLRSLVAAPGVEAVVYVDSNSSDGSVAFAESLGVATVVLDTDRPFTAARARNAGVARLSKPGARLSGAESADAPPLTHVFFIDGDCELVPGFLEAGLSAMRERPDVVAVGGRRRERHREATVYNLLCDMEWDRPTGEVTFFGGEGLVARPAFDAVGGFDDTLIAGEEPELCHRLRAAGGRIWTVDHDVAIHDADMHRFGQWWKRAERAGHAYAEGHAQHGDEDGYYGREVRSIIAYGLGGVSAMSGGVSLTPCPRGRGGHPAAPRLCIPSAPGACRAAGSSGSAACRPPRGTSRSQ